MNVKNIVIVLILGIAIYSCKKSSTVPFNAADQAAADDVSLVKYLETHYLNTTDGGLYTINNGEAPLMNSVQIQLIDSGSIVYKLYYLKIAEGVGVSPTKTDSVLVNYTGMLLDSTVFDSRQDLTWVLLKNTIRGWGEGLPNFKTGTKVINPDESFEYTNYGKGFLFIPSGLAYGNKVASLIPENSPLIFQISLKDIKQN